MRRYTTLLVLTGLMFGGLIGCELPSIPLELPSNSGNDAENSGNNSADSADNAPTDDGGNLQNQPVSGYVGSSVMLWKPQSNDGKLCVLLPYKLYGSQIVLVKANGEKAVKMYYPVLNDDGTYRNGGRYHIRFGRPGSAYGNNVKLEATFKDGRKLSWTIPTGADRFEKR